MRLIDRIARKLAPAQPAGLQINYPPDFAVRWGHGKPPAKHILGMIERKRAGQQYWLDQLAELRPHFDRIPVEGEGPHWGNPWLPPLDAISLYGALALLKPRLLIEIGSGNSTMFARRAIEDHNLPTRITSLDPVPRAEIDDIADECLRTGLEHADLALFDQLEAGDVVFFDGSHRAFQNSDVTVFFIDVLPALPKGVLVGIHDIFWPDDYPPGWRERYYSEQYMLGAWMLGAGEQFDLTFSCGWAGANLDCQRCLSAPVSIKGGALWFKTS